jgi:hypothetical protein
MKRKLKEKKAKRERVGEGRERKEREDLEWRNSHPRGKRGANPCSDIAGATFSSSNASGFQSADELASGH